MRTEAARLEESSAAICLRDRRRSKILFVFATVNPSRYPFITKDVVFTLSSRLKPCIQKG